jgi:Uma2 family endonuclease
MAAHRIASTSAPFVHEYLIEEDELGDSAAQTRLLDYLTAVLTWLYRASGWFIARDLTFYHPAIRNSQQMISPDIAVFKGLALTVEQRWGLTSWDMRTGERPCPPVVFEVSSGSTWQTDIRSGEDDKPHLYGQMGVREYIAYDPNREPVWRGVGGRLLGWRYDACGAAVPLTADARGRLWSEELESWLVPDEALLRLYDGQGVLRLTEAEAERMAREAEQAARLQTEERLAAAVRALREHGIDLNGID